MLPVPGLLPTDDLAVGSNLVDCWCTTVTANKCRALLRTGVKVDERASGRIAAATGIQDALCLHRPIGQRLIKFPRADDFGERSNHFDFLGIVFTAVILVTMMQFAAAFEVPTTVVDLELVLMDLIRRL